MTGAAPGGPRPVAGRLQPLPPPSAGLAPRRLCPRCPLRGRRRAQHHVIVTGPSAGTLYPSKVFRGAARYATPWPSASQEGVRETQPLFRGRRPALTVAVAVWCYQLRLTNFDSLCLSSCLSSCDLFLTHGLLRSALLSPRVQTVEGRRPEAPSACGVSQQPPPWHFRSRDGRE